MEGAQLECGEEEGGDDERPLPRDHLQAGHEALQRVRAREQEVRQHRRPAHVHDRAHRRAEERAAGAERDVVVRLGVGVAEIVPHAPEQDPRVRAEEPAAHADQQPDDPAEAGHCERQPEEAGAHDLGHEDERRVVPAQRQGSVWRERGRPGSTWRPRSPLGLAQVVRRRLRDEHVGLARFAVALRHRRVRLHRGRRWVRRRHPAREERVHEQLAGLLCHRRSALPKCGPRQGGKTELWPKWFIRE